MQVAWTCEWSLEEGLEDAAGAVRVQLKGMLNTGCILL